MPPLTSTSTSICLARAASISVSPAGTICCPCTTPILSDWCCIVKERGKCVFYKSRQPSSHIAHTALDTSGD